MKILEDLNKKEGFTLIKILVVIGIIAILAAIVIIAINPAKQFAQARNTQRTSNVNAILNAIGQRIADNKGIFEGDFTVGGTTYSCPDIDAADDDAICTDSGTECPAGGINLECLVPTYISTLPLDPEYNDSQTDTDDTLYTLTVGEDCDGGNAPGRIAVKSLLAGDEDSIPDAAIICVVR